MLPLGIVKVLWYILLVGPMTTEQATRLMGVLRDDAFRALTKTSELIPIYFDPKTGAWKKETIRERRQT